MTRVIDLNCDLGEGFGVWTLGDDDALLDIVTSANVACGFHGGDPSIMRRVCARAAERGVVIGAQVSYHDLVGFGRRPMDVPAADLTNDVLYQLGALEAFCRVAGTAVRYVKPHGALYHRVIHDRAQAEAVVTAISRYDQGLALLCSPDSVIAEIAHHAGITAVSEAFADRAYTVEGTLVPRGVPGAVITDHQLVVARSVGMATTGQLSSVDGTEIPVRARSLCVHGDTPGAVAMARDLRTALSAAGVSITAFAGEPKTTN